LNARSRRRWTALAVTVLGTILAIGPAIRVGEVWVRPLPWEWFAWVIPGFATQRHQLLSTTIVGVGLTCLAGLGVAWLADRGRERRVWGAVTALLIAAALWSIRAPVGRVAPLPVASGDDIPEVYRWLAAHGDGEPVLELPTTFGANAVYAYYSTYHWLPIFNGTFAVDPPRYVERSERAVAVLDPVTAPAFLHDVPVRWVVVHGALLAAGQRDALADAPPHLQTVARFGDDVLYRVRNP
jgi:hypothetical protein